MRSKIHHQDLSPKCKHRRVARLRRAGHRQAPPNLLTNAGFESGTLYGWSKTDMDAVSIVSPGLSSGSNYCAALHLPGGFYTFALVADGTWEADPWQTLDMAFSVKQDPADPPTDGFILHYLIDGPEGPMTAFNKVFYVEDFKSLSDVRRIHFTSTLPTGTVGVRDVKIQATSGTDATGTFFIDDVYMSIH